MTDDEEEVIMGCFETLCLSCQHESYFNAINITSALHVGCVSCQVSDCMVVDLVDLKSFPRRSWLRP